MDYRHFYEAFFSIRRTAVLPLSLASALFSIIVLKILCFLSNINGLFKNILVWSQKLFLLVFLDFPLLYVNYFNYFDNVWIIDILMRRGFFNEGNSRPSSQPQLFSQYLRCSENFLTFIICNTYNICSWKLFSYFYCVLGFSL